LKLKNHKAPMRRCAGCMESKPKESLIRISYYQEKLTVDATGRANGRGVYLCRNSSCIETAKKKRAFHRSFRTQFPKTDVDQIFSRLEEEIEND